MKVPSQDRRQTTYAKILYCIINILGNVSRANLMIVKYLCPNAMAGKMSGGCDPIDRGPAGAAQEDGQWKLVRVVGSKSAVIKQFQGFYIPKISFNTEHE